MGTAFGIMAMCESVALASFPLISSLIAENEEDLSDGFKNVAFFYASIGLFDLLLASSLYFFDKKGSNVLDPKNVDEYLEQLQDEDEDEDDEDDEDEEDN